MEKPTEVEVLVTELETRVERLRSLYDQYFTGLEKLEPAVARKDVERRMEVLRRMQIRNTGLRFRFQMLAQRYNTYQTYWLRICRQIENGTFKRHVMRAKARFGSEQPWEKGEAPASSELSEDVSLDDLMAEPAPDSRAARAARAVRGFEAGLLAGDGDGLDLELDDAFDRMNAASLPMGAPPRAVPASMPALRGMSSPDLGQPARRAMPSNADIEAAARAPAPSQPQLRPSVRRPMPSGAEIAGPAPSAPEATPQTRVAPGPIARSATTLGLGAPPVLVGRPAAQPSAAAGPVGRTATLPGGAGAAASPPRPPLPSSPRGAAAAPPSTGPGEERVRQIYARYVDTKRANGESTASVTFEALSQSLRESSQKLRDRVGADKKIDFEVATKDGKTVLKPVLR